jgi:hypothetical protein
MFDSFGKMLMWVGGGLLLLGLIFFLLGKVPGLDRLPGDIVIHRENLTVFIPLGTMVLISVLLTVVLNVIARLRK